VTFAENYRAALCAALEKMDLAGVETAMQWFQQARDCGATIFTCGNGGSASTASHMACDLVKGASYQRQQRFRVVALTDLMPTISAYANDVGYDSIFVEPLKNLARAGDIVLAISGSGNSPNVLKAIECANAMRCRTIGLTGRDGGALGRLVHLHINVPEPHMGRIEDLHLMITHMLGYRFIESCNDGPSH
jgi:D-sedoheptulose 7-phosphate isomerase